MPDSVETREREEKLQGMGCSRKRKEDARFTRGQGSYVDDIKLPGMLFGAMVRSPYAHARIKIDQQVQGQGRARRRRGADRRRPQAVNLAWMPTLAGDVQMVLADGKVLFQNQEVAFVVATDRYAAADGADLVEVEYEERCRSSSTRSRRWTPDAPVIREDLAGKTEAPTARASIQPHLHLAGRRQGRDRRAFAKADGDDARGDHLYPRVHPCPLETCQLRRLLRQDHRRADVYGTFQAPHVIRTVVADLGHPRAQDPHLARHRRRLRQQGRRLSRAISARSSPRSSPACRSSGSRPHREPLDDSFARDYHMTTEICRDQGRPRHRACAAHLADHGAFDACAGHQMAGRLFSICTGSYDFPVAHCRSTASTPTRRRAASPIAARSASPRRPIADRARMDIMAQKLGMDPADFRMKNFIRREQFPYTSALGWNTIPATIRPR
jgi:aerobic carbon-monoxide dehydrogenase large subunit